MRDPLTNGHQEYMAVKCITPLYVVNGVDRGIPILLIFDPKHRLWVCVGGSNVYPQLMFSAKLLKISKFFYEIFNFYY